MLALTITSLLNTMSVDFCSLMKQEKDVVKSVLLSYNKAIDIYGNTKVKKVVQESNPIELKALAVSSVISKCPNLF